MYQFQGMKVITDPETEVQKFNDDVFLNFNEIRDLFLNRFK